MGLVLLGVGTLLVLCIAGFGLAVYVTRDEDNLGIDNLLSEDFTRAVATAQDPEKDRVGVVDLREVASFPWDRVVIVQQGTPKAAISRRLGYEWQGQVGIDAGDLLLFMRGAEVVRFADYRGRGHFAGIPRPFAEIPREDAVFEVRDLVIRPRR